MNVEGYKQEVMDNVWQILCEGVGSDYDDADEFFNRCVENEKAYTFNEKTSGNRIIGFLSDVGFGFLGDAGFVAFSSEHYDKERYDNQPYGYIDLLARVYACNLLKDEIKNLWKQEQYR